MGVWVGVWWRSGWPAAGCSKKPRRRSRRKTGRRQRRRREPAPMSLRRTTATACRSRGSGSRRSPSAMSTATASRHRGDLALGGRALDLRRRRQGQLEATLPTACRASPSAAAAWISWTSTRTASWMSPSPTTARACSSILGDGKGNWRTASSGLPTIGAEDVALGDFNNDGCPDLASVAAAEEGVRAFLGNCKGVWKESSEGPVADRMGQRRRDDRHQRRRQPATSSPPTRPARASGWATARAAGREASQGLPAPEIHGLYWGIDAGDLNGDGSSTSSPARRCRRCREGCGAPGAPVCTGGGVEAFLQQPDGTWVFANEGFLPMNALGVAIGDLNNDGKPDVVAVGKRALDEIGGVYGVLRLPGRRHRQVDAGRAGTGLPQTGKERTWGVGIGGRRQGRRAATSASRSATSCHADWRSGGQEESMRERGKAASAAKSAPAARQVRFDRASGAVSCSPASRARDARARRRGRAVVARRAARAPRRVDSRRVLRHDAASEAPARLPAPLSARATPPAAPACSPPPRSRWRCRTC